MYFILCKFSINIYSSAAVTLSLKIIILNIVGDLKIFMLSAY